MRQEQIQKKKQVNEPEHKDCEGKVHICTFGENMVIMRNTGITNLHRVES
jgi:hypothetical protein